MRGSMRAPVGDAEEDLLEDCIWGLGRCEE